MRLRFLKNVQRALEMLFSCGRNRIFCKGVKFFSNFNLLAFSFFNAVLVGRFFCLNNVHR